MVDAVPAHLTALSYSDELVPAAQANPLVSLSATLSGSANRAGSGSMPSTSNISTRPATYPVDDLPPADRAEVMEMAMSNEVTTLAAGVALLSHVGNPTRLSERRSWL
jgi:hypothetical protein